MKMVKKMLSIILILSVLFMVIQTSVFATELDFNSIFSDDIQEIEDTGNEITEENNNETDTTNTNDTTNVASVDETLPKTGITEDYAIIAFAVICGISAIYAYRKARNYNIK